MARRGRPTDRVYCLTAGTRLHNWTIVDVRGAVVEVRCDCGETFTSHMSLVANATSRARTRPRYCSKTCTLKFAAARLKALRSTAKTRGIVVELTVDDVLAIRVGKACHYCGGSLPKWGGGLDRKDSDRGYTRDNVVPCCSDCNTAKASFFSHDEFLAAMQVRVARVGLGNCWPRSPRRPRGARA